MKKLISLLLCAVLVISICGCTKAAENETPSVPEITEAEKNDFVPFEVIKNDIGFVSDNGDAYYHSYRFNTSKRSITYEIDGDVKYFLSHKNDMALLAISGNNLFFRDIVDNIIYRAELSDDIAENSGKMFFVYSGFATIISAGDNVLTLKTNDDKRIELNTMTGELTELKATYLADFKPFNVSGDYLSFIGWENVNLVTKGGIEIFSHLGDDSNTIFYNKNGEQIKLLDANDIILDCIIDNSLYFTADFYSESEALYRLELTENNGVITDTALSFVTAGYYSVVKGEENQLIIRQGEDGSYFTFDTATAKKNNIKFDYTADTESFKSDIKISKSQAVDIALAECKNDKYYDMGQVPTSFTENGIELRVDTAYPTGYRNGIVYEDYPWLVYRVTLNSFAYIITVDVNAQTGKVAYVAAGFKD